MELGERDGELLDHLEQVSGREERVRLGQVRAGLLALGARGEELEEELDKGGGWLEGELLREACAGGGRLFLRIWLSEVKFCINIESSLDPSNYKKNINIILYQVAPLLTEAPQSPC